MTRDDHQTASTDNRFLSRLPFRLAQSRLDTWLPWIVLAGSLAITGLLWQNERRGAERELRIDFDFRAHRTVKLIEERLSDYVRALHGAQGLFAASAHVERDTFRNYVAALQVEQNYPGIQGMGFSQKVTAKEKARHIADIRKNGFPAYAIRPAEERDVYTPMIYHESFSGSDLPFFGFDMSSDRIRRAAMELARDSAEAAISGRLTLMIKDEPEKQASFAIFLPIYKNGMPHGTVSERRANIVGWVSALFQIDHLMADLLANYKKDLDVKIYDGKEMVEQDLLYDSDYQSESSRAMPMRHIEQLQVAGHTWNVALRSRPAFAARLEQKMPLLVAAAGTSIGVLLALLTWQLLGSRTRAVNAASRINRELIESESRYRQMFENYASIAFLLDPDSGCIVDANPAAAAFLGYAQEELRGMSITNISITPHEEIQEKMSSVKEGLVTCLECHFRLRNGDVRDVEVHSSPLIHRGKILLYSMLHDITSRQQAERALRASEERYRLIADNTLDVIWTVDTATLRFTYISPSIQRQRGYTPDEMMRLHNDALFSSSQGLQSEPILQFGKRLRERIRRFREGDESQRYETEEIELPHKDGRNIPIEVVNTFQCDENDLPITLIGISRDITARRQAQEEQRRFIAMVSHEFRTPLATIDGAVQRLEVTGGNLDTATRKRYTNIQKAVDRLTALLDDYLSLDRLDMIGQGMHLHQVAPLALLLDSQASAKALSLEHVVTVKTAGLPDSFFCDADRMRLTLNVLTDNAVKYTAPGSVIELYGCNSPQDGIEFMVSDNGPGIPEYELPHVFVKFFRGRSASRQAGSGLGLYMARSVVEMHGGSLTVRNRPEGGAEFRIWLPCNPHGSSAKNPSSG